MSPEGSKQEAMCGRNFKSKGKVQKAKFKS
jgi:hypothetical protein